MSNLIACIVFNVTGLGASYFLSLLTSSQTKKVNWAARVFWGSWASLLFVYILWLFMSDKLNVVCYISFVIGLVGCFYLFKHQSIISFVKSDYFFSLLSLAPFLFIVSYNPHHCDELSHWVSLPQIFYSQNSLISQEHWHTGNYTPLWTLQATFFQFFTPQGFDASLVYAVRINLFLSFFFFIKEKFELAFLKAACFVLGVLIIFFVTKSAQNLLIEFPLCLLLSALLFVIGETEGRLSKENIVFFFLGLLSLFMLKKPLIVVFPAAFYILWVQGYKKHLGYLILFLGAIYLSWKFKTAHMSEPWQYTFKIETLWNDQATCIYKQLIRKVLQDGLRSFLFLLSFVIIYRWKKEVFRFYLIFSLVYFIGLIVTYVYAFDGYQEAAIKASYVRYVKIVFVPAYVYAYYLLVSTSPRLAQGDIILAKRSISLYIFSFGVALLFACFFYPSLSGACVPVGLSYEQFRQKVVEYLD